LNAKPLIMIAAIALAACSSKTEPLTGEYTPHVGMLSFETTSQVHMMLRGTRDFSGHLYDSMYERKGKKLTITSRPNYKGKFVNTYHFDVIDDGVHLELKKVDSKNEETGKVETTEMPAGSKPDVIFDMRL
jgi:uncharacterized lipoprotein YajG